MEAILDEMKNSVVSLQPGCKLVPSNLPTVLNDVDEAIALLEKSKSSRESKKKLRPLKEFETEVTGFHRDSRAFSDIIENRLDKITKARRNGTANVTRLADDILKVEMIVNDHPTCFEIRFDTESNRFFGVKSEPPVASIERIEELQDLEEIISMMSAAFKEESKKSMTE